MAAPPVRAPIVDKHGMVSPDWISWFAELAGSEDVVVRGGTTVTLVQQTTAQTAPAASGDAADLTGGPIPASAMPALTGDVTTEAGEVETTLRNIPEVVQEAITRLGPLVIPLLFRRPDAGEFGGAGDLFGVHAAGSGSAQQLNVENSANRGSVGAATGDVYLSARGWTGLPLLQFTQLAQIRLRSSPSDCSVLVDSTIVSILGRLFERSRAEAMSEYYDYTPTRSSSGGTTWSGGTATFRYRVTGLEARLKFKVAGFTIDTMGGPATELRFSTPSGYTPAGTDAIDGRLVRVQLGGTWQEAWAEARTAGVIALILHPGGGNWPAATADATIQGDIIYEI